MNDNKALSECSVNCSYTTLDRNKHGAWCLVRAPKYLRRRPGFNPWVRKIPWRREWLPTPVFWPGEFHGLCSPWGRKELDMTERLSLSLLFSLEAQWLTFTTGDLGSVPVRGIKTPHAADKNKLNKKF